MCPATPAPIRQGIPTVDDLDLFRAYCPDPGKPPAGHRDAVVRSLMQDETARPGVRRPGRHRGVLVGAVAAIVALVFAGAIIVHRSGSPTAETTALGPVVVRLDDHLAFMSDEGWDARRVTKQVQRSDGTSETVDALQIANFGLPPGADSDSAWSTIYPSLKGDQVVMTVRSVGPTPPDAGSGGRVHRGLPVQVTETELPSNAGGVVEVFVQVPFEYLGTAYEIEIATDQSGRSALATVNQGLMGLRDTADESGVITVPFGDLGYVVPSGWDARIGGSSQDGRRSSPLDGLALQTGNFRMPEATESDNSGSSFMAALTGDEVYENVLVSGAVPRRRRPDPALRTGVPVRLRPSDFGGYEGMVQRTHAREPRLPGDLVPDRCRVTTGCRLHPV